MSGIDRQALQAIDAFRSPNLTQYAYKRACWVHYAAFNGYDISTLTIAPGIKKELQQAILQIRNPELRDYMLRRLDVYKCPGIDRKLLKVLNAFPVATRDSAYHYLGWFRYVHVNYKTPLPPAGTNFRRNKTIVKAAVLSIRDPLVRAYARKRLDV